MNIGQTFAFVSAMLFIVAILQTVFNDSPMNIRLTVLGSLWAMFLLGCLFQASK